MSASFDTSRYGPIIAELLREERLPPLDAGTPNLAVKSKLQSLEMSEALAPSPVVDGAMAEACKAGLWLYHDFLEESHVISQSISTSTGSYWHGIMHRREPDFSNAKYWFRQVGRHPIFPELCKEAARLAQESPRSGAEFLTARKEWDPFAFVDLCEQALRGKLDCAGLCRRIQRREWELLFDYCYDRALGSEV